MKTKVHPAFDGKWFIEFENGPRVEAPTLAILQVKLGRHYSIEGYYPDGFKEKIVYPKDTPLPKKMPAIVQAQVRRPRKDNA